MLAQLTEQPTAELPFITWAAENTAGSHGEVQRRGRASAIGGARRAWLRASPGHLLVEVSRAYSEAHGFLHRSAFRYRVIWCDAVTGGRPAGNCPGDWTERWDGHATPALGCGYHAAHFPEDMHAGREIRLRYEEEQRGKAGADPRHYTWPYH